MRKKYQIIKQDGRRQLFSQTKFLRTAKRVGVPASLQPQLLDYIYTHLYPDITTKEILRLTKNFLRRHHHPAAIRYNLKRALSELGPSGYPFEKYLAELLKTKGYQTQTNIVLQGQCVAHEIDVLATKDSHTYLIEAKFHNRSHLRSDVKVALYVHSRFQDIKANWSKSTQLQPWLITNTRFTLDTLRYGQCANLRLTSWDYPQQDSLRGKIEAAELHPITILENISQQTKTILFQQGIVTCKQVLTHRQTLKPLLSPQEYQRLLQEVNWIYQPSTHS